jgi:hypothetical protein
MTAQMNPKCLVSFSPGETTLLQVDADQSACFVPKTLKWDQISIPRGITVPNPQPPRHLTQREASEIIEREDEIDVKFDFRSRSYNSSMNFMSRPHIEPMEGSRFSTSSYQTVGRQPSEIGSQAESHIHYKMPVSEPVHVGTSAASPHMSPTYSQMRRSINVIKNPFQIDKESLREEFLSPENTEKRKWFFSTHTKEQQAAIREEWYATMNKIEINIPFFLLFKIHHQEETSSINVTKQTSHKWTLNTSPE